MPSIFLKILGWQSLKLYLGSLVRSQQNASGKPFRGGSASILDTRVTPVARAILLIATDQHGAAGSRGFDHISVAVGGIAQYRSAKGGMAFSSAPQVELQTSIGTIVVELYVKHAPKTCKNFRELARRGYYNNTVVSSQALYRLLLVTLCIAELYTVVL